MKGLTTEMKEPGDWTKKVSNLTFDELDSLGKF